MSRKNEASDAIAARCNVEMAFPRAHLPVYENRYGVSSVQFLNTLCKKGLAKRIGLEPGAQGLCPAPAI